MTGSSRAWSWRGQRHRCSARRRSTSSSSWLGDLKFCEVMQRGRARCPAPFHLCIVLSTAPCRPTRTSRLDRHRPSDTTDMGGIELLQLSDGYCDTLAFMAEGHLGWGAGQGSEFATTHWSLVLSAADSPSPDSRRALGQLCELYWYPLYACVRRQGHRSDEAQDLTQAFFARLLEKRTLDAADRTRGRFRCFLLTSLKNFLANEWDRSHSKKRGGSQRMISLDGDNFEERYRNEPAHDLSPERLFDRRWAIALLHHVLDE